MAANKELRVLARRLAILERARLNGKQPSLGFSTIDGGALQAANEDGDLTLIIGQQFDDTNTAAVVTGPTPPTPTIPYLTSQAGALRIYWDGTFSDALHAPMDFARVIAYATPLSVFSSPEPLNQTTMVGQFASATGGELTAALDSGVEYAIYLVCWTQAGKYGTASLVATATTGFNASSEEIQVAVDLANSKSTIYRSPTPPWADGALGHSADAGDMWFDTTLEPGPQIGVASWAAVGGEVTLVTGGDHGLSGGASIAVADVDPAVDGTFTISWIPDSTSLVYATSVPDTPSTDVGGTVQALGASPRNRPYIWDGSNWIDVRDSGIDDVSTLINGTAVQISTTAEELAQTQQDLATLAVTANDAYDQAYAADGRVSISDYEPTAADVEGKNDGSLWITRTRDRLNECANPSFESALTGWTSAGASTARTASAPAGDGDFVCRATNTGLVEVHEVRVTAQMAVSAGEQISASGYLKSVSGSTTGYQAFIRFYTAGGSLLETALSDPVDLVVSGFTRAWAAGVAPESTSYAIIGFQAPQGAFSAVWDLDAVLLERSSYLGRYFDGDSEGGAWLGADFLSKSTLDGNAIIRLFTLEDGGWAEKLWTAETIASVSASVIDRGQMNGGFLADGSIPVDKLYVPDAIASQALTAGDIVNIHNNGGIAMARRADATELGRDAHGFVLSDVGIGALAKVYTSGYNPLLSGLTPGVVFLSTTPGEVSSAPPQDKGYFVQRVGTAVADGTLNFAALQSVALT